MGRKITDIAQAVGLSVLETRRWLRQMGVSGRSGEVDEALADEIIVLLRRQLADTVPAPPEPATEPIEVVLERHANRLLQLPGVVGVGERQDARGQLYIEVMLSVPPKQVQGIPPFLDGYAVRLVYTGRIVAR
jgi:hypothetical protein